jgi:flavin-binding protein dodecin
MGEYDGRGWVEERDTIVGVSTESLDDALRVAVHNSKAEPGTTYVISLIEVVTEGDPKIGEYRVTLSG